MILNDTNSEIVPYYDSIGDCTSNYLTRLYNHTIHHQSGKFLAIWGCYQINEDLHDRGLWILGVDEISNVSQIIDEVFEKMGLSGVSLLKPSLKRRDRDVKNDTCTTDGYFHTCHNLGAYEEENVVPHFVSPKKFINLDSKTIWIVICASVISIITGFLIFCACKAFMKE